MQNVYTTQYCKQQFTVEINYIYVSFALLYTWDFVSLFASRNAYKELTDQ